MLHNPRIEIEHEAKQILHDAAVYLETHGWCQGAMRHEGNVCLIGAISDGRGDHCGPMPENVVAEIMARLRAVTSNNVPAWNDAPGRTKEQVIAALRRAAK